MSAIDKKWTDKVRKTFERDNVQVSISPPRIEVYWNRSPEGRIWIPFSGGPLYADQAKDATRKLAESIEEFRSLLPKAIRTWAIVVGEMDCKNFPSNFYPAQPQEGTP